MAGSFRIRIDLRRLADNLCGAENGSDLPRQRLRRAVKSQFFARVIVWI